MRKILSLMFIATLLLSVTGLQHAAAQKDQVNRYYDPVSGQFISQEQLDKRPIRELLLEVKVNNLILGEIATQEIDGTLWASLSEVVLLLDFPIIIKTLENHQVEAKGWFINERNLFSLTPSVEKDGLSHQLKTDKLNKTIHQIKHINNEAYFPLTDVLSWFNIESESDVTALTLTLYPAERLPIQDKKRRQQREALAHVSFFDAQFPREDVEYQALSPILTDIQLTARKEVDGQKNISTSILGSGDLAYMTGRYYLNHRYDEQTENSTFNASMYLERNSIQADLLGPLQATHYSIGDNRHASIANLPSSNAFGIRVSNRPYGRITNLSTTDISGLQQPGWDVELYLNDLFISSQTIGEDGQYNFLQQPLQIGENRFTLRFFGLQGQRETLETLYVLDPSAAVGGKLIYDASIAKQNFQFSDFFENNQTSEDDYYQVNLHLEQGLNQNVSLTGDYSQYHFSNGKLHRFIQPGVRLFLGKTLFNINHLQDLNAGSQSKFNVSRSLGLGGNHVLNYSFQAQTKNFAKDINNESNLRQVQSIGINGRLPTPGLSYSMGATFTKRFDSSSENFTLSLGKQFGRLSLNNNLNYSIAHQVDNSTSSSLLGRINTSINWHKFFLRSSLYYSLEPNSQVNSGSLEGQWNINSDFKTKLRYSYNTETGQNNESMTLNWRTSKFVTSVVLDHTAGNWRGQLNLQFSLGINPITHKGFIGGSQVATSGAVVAQVFEDLNNNQKHDENEPFIENAEVVAVQQHRRGKTDEQGVVLLTGLHGTQVTDIKVNPKSLEDPFWLPTIEGISFLPRPGIVKTMLIPVVTAGEIEGTVKYSKDLFNAPYDQGGVPLVITNRENGKEIEVESTYDGFFLFSRVPPGNYTLQIKPHFLKIKSIETRSPIPITIGHRGTLILGANFTLHPKGKFDYSSEGSSITDAAYNIDLGEFMSEQNARTILGALRNVFPTILSEMGSQPALEMLMLKKSAHKFQLLLGPVFDLNQIKYICGSLAKENLKCEAQKTTVKKASHAIENTPYLQTQIPEPIAHPTVTPKPVALQPNLGLLTPKLTSVQDFNPKDFTLQIMNTSNQFGLEKFIEEHLLEDARILEVIQNNEERFILSVGAYPSREMAQQEAAQIEAYLKIKPWIRTFESIRIKTIH